MTEKNTLNQVALTAKNNLLTLVENRKKFDLEDAQLNIYETHKKAEKVQLQFSDLVLTSMLRGKKIMHLPDKVAFDYLPGESVIIPSNNVMEIDFPEANEETPTQCLALVISKDSISSTLNLLNEKHPKVDSKNQWNVDHSYFYLPNSNLLADAINQLVRISLFDKTVEKGTIAKLKTQEVLIRLMQTQARVLIENEYQSLTNNPFATVVKFIKENLDFSFTIELLCRKACMSKANFHKKFVSEYGITPAAFIQLERIKRAKFLLKNTAESVGDVAYQVGFNNVAHFITYFKKVTGFTPKAYQLAC